MKPGVFLHIGQVPEESVAKKRHPCYDSPSGRCIGAVFSEGSRKSMENQNGSGKYQPRFAAPEGGKKPGKPWIIVLCVIGALLVIGGSILTIILLGNVQSEELAAETEPPATEAPITEPPTTEPPTEPPETEPPAEETEQLPYAPDDALLEAIGINPDIYGRLSYGDVDPQYIVYPSNNSTYLNHDAFGSYDREGAAFIDCRCTIDPRDTNLMIHGHNMNVANSGNGKAFATLFRFQNRDYMAEYPIFTLETENDVQYYVPYALSTAETAYGMPGFFSIIEWNFASDDSFNYYVGYYMNNTKIKMPVTAEPGDQLLTLSTCINDGNSRTELRLLVCLRLLREDETVEGMRQLYWLHLGSHESKLAWRQRQSLELQ